jgi:hypothetical protein
MTCLQILSFEFAFSLNPLMPVVKTGCEEGADECLNHTFGREAIDRFYSGLPKQPAEHGFIARQGGIWLVYKMLIA